MKIKIVDAGLGAYGCNGLTGVITNVIATNGVSSETPGYNVRLDNGEIWRIRQSAKVKILETEESVNTTYRAAWTRLKTELEDIIRIDEKSGSDKLSSEYFEIHWTYRRILKYMMMIETAIEEV